MSFHRRLVLALGLLSAALGCANPGASTDIELVPIFESERPYPHHFTYYLNELTQTGNDVRVYMDFINGYSRSINGVSVWITLLGASGEQRVHQHPVGPMSPQETEHLIFKVENVLFPVDDIQVGVLVTP